MLMKHYSYETWAESYIELMCIAANVQECMAIESLGDGQRNRKFGQKLKGTRACLYKNEFRSH